MNADWFKAQLVNKLSLHTRSPNKNLDLLNAAVSLVFFLQNDTIELLFIERAKHPKDPWSGHIAFPGGGFEESDNNLLATAIRETQEELGFDLNEKDYVGSLSSIYGPIVGHKKTVSITPFIFVLSDKPKIAPNYEVERSFWFPLASLMKQDNIETFKHPSLEEYQMRGIELSLDSGTLLWGLSLDVLYSLFNKIELPTEQELLTFQKIT